MIPAPPIPASGWRQLAMPFELYDRFGQLRARNARALPLVSEAVHSNMREWRLLWGGRLVGQAADRGKV